MKIAIVDYGTGNLRSVGQAVRAVADGADVTVTKSAAEIDAADRVIFPGQGAMGDCMRCLGESGLKEAVLRALANKSRDFTFLGNGRTSEDGSLSRYV